MCGVASVWGAKADENTASPGPTSSFGGAILGIVLALLGQVVQAAQVAVEEWLLKDVDLPGLLIVGVEGVWGSLLMLLIVFPVVGYYNLEDEHDTWTQIMDNRNIQATILVYSFSCATYNVVGMLVTHALSALHRVMLEALRTTIIWAFGLLMYYGVSSGSQFGEAWTPYSYLEVIGFFFLIGGQAVYGAILQIPGLRYSDAAVEIQPDLLRSPAAVKTMASPLPPAGPR